MFVVNVEGAIHRNGQWLLILRSEKEEHAGGTLSLVGGKCEAAGFASDVLENTLHREIFEEVGCEVADLQYVNSSSFVTDAGVHVINVVYLCRHKNGEPYAKSSEEVDQVLWRSTSEIVNDMNLPGYLRENVRMADRLLQAQSCRATNSMKL